MGNLKVISVDATHNIGPKSKLTTVMTVNEYFEGESLGFCICESESTEMMKEFFGAIKSRIGRTINCRYFISDDANAFYNAWIEVMCDGQRTPSKRLCTWHVNTNWNAKITTVPDIQVNETSDLTYRKQLKTKLFDLRSELSKTVFDTKLTNFLDFLKSNEAFKTFEDYVLRHYLERYEQWAYAYLPDDGGCNTNMHLEAWHKKLKYCYLRGKSKTRLDFFCNQLLLSDKDAQKTCERYEQVGHQNKRTRKVRQTHVLATELWKDGKLAVERSDTHEYLVQFTVEENGLFYVVTEMSKDATHVCSFQCKSCRTCIHLFSCTCKNYRVKMEPCIHLHAISLDKKIRFGFEVDENQNHCDDESETTENDDNLSINTEGASEIDYEDQLMIETEIVETSDPTISIQNELILLIEDVKALANNPDALPIKKMLSAIEKLKEAKAVLKSPQVLNEITSFPTTPSRPKRIEKQPRRSPKKICLSKQL
jgi:hypothetical protein